MSQEDLAHESGIARSYVSTIERGLGNVALDHLMRLAEILAVEATELVPTRQQVRAASHTLPSRRAGRP
jgi:transcriptional regulator with XRE-family HTH domain